MNEPSIVDIELPSALFPFDSTEVLNFSYGRYRLKNVFGRISNGDIERVTGLWARYRVLPSPEMADARVREVCYLMEESETGELVGVNTLYPEAMVQGGPRFFKNRMFIAPPHRRSRLMITATAATLVYGKLHLAEQGLPGILNINENRKLGEPGMKRIFQRLGYRLIGQVKGQDVWLFPFSATRLIESTD